MNEIALMKYFWYKTAHLLNSRDSRRRSLSLFPVQSVSQQLSKVNINGFFHGMGFVQDWPLNF